MIYNWLERIYVLKRIYINNLNILISQIILTN